MFWHFYRDAYSNREKKTAKKSVAIQSTDDNLNELKLNGNGGVKTNGNLNGDATGQPQYLYTYKKAQKEVNGSAKNGSAKKGKKGKR